MIRLSLNHPVAVISLFAVLVFAGLVTWVWLPVELLPSLKHPRLVVITSFGSASAEEVESLLTRPVEEAVGTVSGLRSVDSVSSEGVSTVTLKFDWGTNISMAAAEVREKLDLITDEFPRDAKLPIVAQYDPSDAPIMTLALTGAEDLTALQSLARNKIKTELETVNGVAAVRLSGGLSPEIQILADESRLAAHSIDLKTLSNFLEKANINFPGGRVMKGSLELPVRTVGRFKTIEEIRSVSIGRGDEGGTIRVKDVAEVEEAHKDRTSISRVNSKSAVLLSIVKESTANTLSVSGRVKDKLAEIKRTLPANAGMEIVDDEAPFVEDSLKNLRSNMLEGSGLAFLALLIALRSLGTALLIMIAVPVSVFSTYAFMSFAGVSLNIMSIGGMALGIGMLVDCSIVVLQNVHKKRAVIPDLTKAVEVAVGEVASSLVSGTLTILVVLVPIMFMSGLAQRLFRDFAFTLASSLLMSLLTAIIFLPALIVSVFRKNPKKVQAPQSRLETAYGRVLFRVVKRPLAAILVSAVLFCAGLYGVNKLGLDLLPNINVGEFTIALTLPPDASIDRVEKAVDRVEDTLKQFPDIAEFVTQAGADRSKDGQEQAVGKSNEANIWVKLKPGSLGYEKTAQLVDMIREQLGASEGITVNFRFRQGPLARVLGNQGAPELLKLLGDDLEVMSGLASELEQKLRKHRLFQDVATAGNTWNDQLRVIVDRYQAASRNISIKDVAQTVRTAIEGTVVGKYVIGSREQDIRVRLKTREHTSVKEIRDIPLLGVKDQVAFLGQIADVKTGKGPREILRSDRKRSMIFHANVEGGANSKGEEVALQAASSMKFPENYSVEPGSERAERMASIKSLGLAMVLAVVLIYSLLVAQFESLRWPLVIFASIPMIIIGPAAALNVLGYPISALVLIGTLVLMGIVVNNAILLVATINARAIAGENVVSAIIKGSMSRMEPILITTATTVLGALPICLAKGGAAPLHKPLALTVAAGLGVSTLFTLFLIPAVYKLLAGPQGAKPGKVA